MKTFALILLAACSALGQTTVGVTKLSLATNWVMLPVRECTNNCCRDKWPATVQWEGTIVTNRLLVATNGVTSFTVRLEEFPRNTIYSKPKRSVGFGVAIENEPAIIATPTNKVIAIEIAE